MYLFKVHDLTWIATIIKISTLLLETIFMLLCCAYVPVRVVQIMSKPTSRSKPKTGRSKPKTSHILLEKVKLPCSRSTNQARGVSSKEK